LKNWTASGWQTLFLNPLQETAADLLSEDAGLNRSTENRKQRAAGFSPRGRPVWENGTSPVVWTYF
jgi:hypothetical protein